jgi:hypothetical protein
VHRLTIEADDGQDVVFVCPDCRRRVVVSRSGEFTVIHQGDFFAFHVGGTAGLAVGPVVPAKPRRAG